MLYALSVQINFSVNYKHNNRELYLICIIESEFCSKMKVLPKFLTFAYIFLLVFAQVNTDVNSKCKVDYNELFDLVVHCTMGQDVGLISNLINKLNEYATGKLNQLKFATKIESYCATINHESKCQTNAIPSLSTSCYNDVENFVLERYNQEIHMLCENNGALFKKLMPGNGIMFYFGDRDNEKFVQCRYQFLEKYLGGTSIKSTLSVKDICTELLLKRKCLKQEKMRLGNDENFTLVNDLKMELTQRLLVRYKCPDDILRTISKLMEKQ